jgi:hypothetical protein
LTVHPIYGHGTIVLLLIVHLLLGYRRLQDLRYYRDGPLVRRLRGQVEAIERALEVEAGCERVLQLIAASRGAMNGLMAEVVEDLFART